MCECIVRVFVCAVRSTFLLSIDLPLLADGRIMRTIHVTNVFMSHIRVADATHMNRCGAVDVGDRKVCSLDARHVTHVVMSRMSACHTCHACASCHTPLTCASCHTCHACASCHTCLTCRMMAHLVWCSASMFCSGVGRP